MIEAFNIQTGGLYKYNLCCSFILIVVAFLLGLYVCVICEAVIKYVSEFIAWPLNCNHWEILKNDVTDKMLFT